MENEGLPTNSATQICLQHYRLSTFNDSVFKKNRKHCTPENMASAGFYYSPSGSHCDQVICYACGTEVYGWNLKEDDPLAEHAKIKPECLYVQKKTSYEHKMTLREFLEVENYRYRRLAEMTYLKKRKEILRAERAYNETYQKNEA